MARVIKGGGGAGGQKPPRPPTRVVVDHGLKKVIGRDVFQAKQDAEHILKRAEQERQSIIADGKKMAARAKEEAAARGASEAFAAAAAEALTAFRKRAERYGEASDDVRVLALEVVKKVLGNEPDLGPTHVERILSKGMAQLRARRRLRLQVSHKRLGELASERPNLMKALQSEPDLVVEGVDDVSTGFARVVTEIGGALCAEETALDALSQAVNVRETPRDARAGRASTGNTAAGDGPDGLSGLRRGRTSAVSGASGASAPSGESLPSAALEEIEEIQGEEVAADETINLGPRGLTKRPDMARAPRARTEEIEEISAQEDASDDRSARTARVARSAAASVADDDEDQDDRDMDATEAARAVRVPTGQVRASARPATRAVPLASDGDLSREDLDATLRHAPVLDKKKDDDLDLFTDDAPRKRR
jgi:flagellar biosynthesis/type III secretory pathway protein FliH